MIKMLTAFFCFLSFSCVASEYQVSQFDVGSHTDVQWGVTAINDKGQVLGSYQKGDQPKIYIYDAKYGFTLIESKNNAFLQPKIINNAGQILGYDCFKPFIWSKTLGIRYLNIFDSNAVGATSLNDLGQIIGSYMPVGSNVYRPYMWDYGVVTDMGPGSEFALNFGILGFHIMDIQLTSINNKGELVGYFAYGKYNKKKQKYIAVGRKTFFWNGEIHLLPLPDSAYARVLNNQGVILANEYNSNTTFLWDVQNGLQLIYNFEGDYLNDKNIILGNVYSEEGTPAIWKDGIISSLADLLDVEDIHQLAPTYSDTYAIEGINNFCNINNKGQIPCMGSIWGDLYPCLLDPVKKIDVKPDLQGFMDSYNRYRETDKGSTLRYAIRNKYVDVMAHLIGAGPNSYNDSDECLFVAAETGNIEAISLMSDRGWDIKSRKKNTGESLLHEAAQFGNAELCQDLISLGLNYNDRALQNKMTPLHSAMSMASNAKNSTEIKKAYIAARVLLCNGADPNIEDVSGTTPLYWICGNGTHPSDIVDSLLKFGADPNKKHPTGTSPLSVAVQNMWQGNSEYRLRIIHLLLENGANVNERTNPNNFTCPIAKAIELDDSEVVEMMIEHGADLACPIRVSQFGNTLPLDYAIRLNKKKCIAILNKYHAPKSPSK